MSQQVSLQKSLSPLQVCALALGSIVGWGCFVLPGDMFLPQAGPLGTLIGFAIGALCMTFVAIAYSYMISYAPVAGGEFAYAYIGYGRKMAFICGWALVIGYVAIVMINISAMSLIFRFLFPGVFQFGELYTIAGWHVYTGEVVLSILITIGFGYLNFRGVGFAGKFQVVLAMMLTFGILALFTGSSTLDTAALINLQPTFAENRSVISCILIIVAISPFLFVGFDTIPQAAEEFAFDPSRARRLMLIAIYCGMALYSLVTLSVALAIPYPEMLKKMATLGASGGHAWATADVATMAFGKLGAVVLTCAVGGAVCTGINGFFVASSRLILAMSRARMIPDWLGYIHPKYQTPSNAIIFVTLLALTTPFAGRSAIGWTVDMSAVGTAFAYLFTCMVARRVLLQSPNPSQGGILCCYLGSLSSILCIVLLLCPGSPSLIAFAPRCVLVLWVLLGIIFFYCTRSTWSNLSEEEMKMNILGTTETKVFFKQ